LAVSGVPLVVLAELAPPTDAFLAAWIVGAAMASMGSILAIMRVGSLGGIAARAAPKRLDAVVVAGVLWSVALAVALVRALGGEQAAALTGPQTSRFALVVASLGSLGVTLVAAMRLYAERRRELGVPERAAAALWLSILCLTVGVLATLVEVALPERVVPYAAFVAALCVTLSATSREAALVSRILRTVAALTLLCAPIVSVAVVFAYKEPTHAGLVLFVSTAAAACAGLLAGKLAVLLAPEQGRWLRVLEEAVRAAKQAEPEQSIIGVLCAVRAGLPRDASQPALLRLTSSEQVTVDRAGYIHTERATVPAALIEVAMKEPEQVVATETLRHVQTQRPDVRGVVTWLDERGAGVAALVLDDDVAVGVLLWPAVGRVQPLSCDEVSAFRRLADHLGVASGAAAQLARSREQEMAAGNTVRDVTGKLARIVDQRRLELGRHRAETALHARRLEVACYSPAAHAARVALEALAAGGADCTLATPPGVDARPWAAAFHLASPRAEGPLFVVDATREHEHALALWMDADRSPIAGARSGSLLVLAPHLLPRDTQRYIAMQLPDDVTLLLALPDGLAALAEQDGLEENLLDRMAGQGVTLPGLADRAEDLRALALHILATLGQRVRGREYGLSLAAQELLNEHYWPGNDAELEAVLLRAVLETHGDVVDKTTLTTMIGEPLLSRSGPQRVERIS